MWAPRAALLSVILPLLALASPASAQVDAGTRAQARALAEAGLQRESAGDDVGALANYDGALALVEVPTVGLFSAQCLARLGRLVEAAERYRRTLGMTVDPTLPAGWRAEQIKALEQAKVERDALSPRLAHLAIALQGARPDEVELRIDGRVIPAATIGGERPVDPGTHQVEARRGSDVATAAAALAEGQHDRVVLRLPPRVEAAPPAGAGPISSASPAPGPAGPPPRAAGAPQRLAGGVVAGVGGVGVIAGAVTWGLAFGKRSSLDGACPGQTCRGAAPPSLGDYDTLRTATIVSLTGGGALLIGGVVTAVVAPSSARTPPVVAVTPWLGPAAAGLRGWF